ncbi:MAG TPA: hypothetical protein PKD91_03835 [Bacteroidia bacterium]|nr:hypothetical protein [Bacteroidia bacterium]
MDHETLYEERQFIGANKSSMSLRIFLALFCFVAYYYTDVPEVNGDLLFLLGVTILVISVLLLFVTHIHTRIYKGYILLDGAFNARKVKIQLDSIVKAEKINYSTYIINNPVYNLHREGVIKFYTGGKEAVRLTDREGLKYIIGSHKPDEFLRVIHQQMIKN